ncbi:MAG: alanine--tRNA ligase, partial [Muribaculaceae bacterium]|nr:alanine--tRNA ligase [Muribaculaceae bacterium]
LYDTYGFPLDLTLLILKENGMTLDQAGFDAEMEAQKQRARNAAAVEATDWVNVHDGEQEFVGYDKSSVDTEILRYRQVKQKNREYYQIILRETPFYAEMGGQVGDRGTLTDLETGENIEIFDTKRENGIGVHLVKKMPSTPAARFRAEIDEEARMATSRNHSATHLLHEALREVLGSHVEQRGSFVSPEVLRFDFSHFQKLTPEEIKKVERIVNRRIRQAIARDEHRNVPIEEARAMGAMALFGEKYGDEVRVIRYGDSVELCGGTHVDNTGNIGMLRILSESSIAAGIRRIEAITGENVENAMDELAGTLRDISGMLNNAPDIVAALRRSIDENAELRKQAEDYFQERVNNLTAQLLEKATIENGVKIVELKGVRLPEVVKNVAFAVRAKVNEPTAFVAATVDPAGKPLLTVMLTDELVK